MAALNCLTLSLWDSLVDSGVQALESLPAAFRNAPQQEARIPSTVRGAAVQTGVRPAVPPLNLPLDSLSHQLGQTHSRPSWSVASTARPYHPLTQNIQEHLCVEEAVYGSSAVRRHHAASRGDLGRAQCYLRGFSTSKGQAAQQISRWMYACVQLETDPLPLCLGQGPCCPISSVLVSPRMQNSPKCHLVIW